MTHEQAVQRMCDEMGPHLKALVDYYGWAEAISILKVLVEDGLQYELQDEFERVPLT